MAKPVRTKNKDNARRAKKKVSLLLTERVEYVDYKDVNLLRRFMSDRAKIRARRVTGNSAQQQAEIARAIKNAREMALLPYASRVTQTRGPKRDGERGGRRERDRDLPAPDTEPMSRRRATSSELGDEVGTERRAIERRRARRGDGRRRGGRGVKLVLRADVAQVGKKGDIVDVADGYGRNFLLPKGLAFVATAGRRGAGRHDAPEPRRHATPATGPRPRRSPRALVPKVVTIAARAGAEGKLFGSVTTAEIADAVAAQTGVEHRPAPAPPRRADQDARHAPGAGQAPRRGRVPDHRRGRRLLGGRSPGPRTPRRPASTRPAAGVVHRSVHSRNADIPRVSPTLCLW